jgi:Fe-S cluster assembly protein SufD
MALREEPMQLLDQSTFDQLTATAPAWANPLRAAGFERFLASTMPAPNEESWKYVDLDFSLADFSLAERGSPIGGSDEVAAALGDVAGRAMIANGFAETAGSKYATLVTAATSEGEVASLFGTAVDPAVDLFAAAHHAFFRDGVFLRVPAGTAVDRPFYVDVQATGEGTVSFPHVTVVVERDAEASVVIGFRSPEGTRLVVNPHVEVFVRDAGRLKLTTYQRFGADTRAIVHERIVIGRDATVNLGEIGLGGALGRVDLTMEFQGNGGHADLVGAFYGEHDQTLDYRLVMHHVGVSTSSDVFLKGAVQDHAESIFTGLVRIENEASKTSAFETNRNLVLSDGARANSVPNLEILCDDVICGHGSTVGPLDEEPLYYLMSRGLSRPRAARLLVRGFFEEALERLPQPELATPARVAVNRRFITAQQEGRV